MIHRSEGAKCAMSLRSRRQSVSPWRRRFAEPGDRCTNKLGACVAVSDRSRLFGERYPGQNIVLWTALADLKNEWPGHLCPGHLSVKPACSQHPTRSVMIESSG